MSESMDEQTPAAAAAVEPSGRRGHPVIAWILLALAVVILIVSSLTVWVKRQVVSDENWRNASGQMLEDPAVRNAVSTYLVNQVFTNVDVSAELKQQLPENMQALALPLSVALREVSLRTANALLARPATIELWKDANEVAHKQLMAVINDDKTYLSTSNGEVVLDLGPVVEKLGDSLVGQKLLESLPNDSGRIVLLRSDQLKTAQTATKTLKALSVLLTIVALALLAGAVWLAPDRRRMLFWVGMGAIGAGLVVLIARRASGNYLIDALTDDVPDVQPAAAAVWGITTQLLKNIGISLIAYGAAIGLAAMLAGPTRAATKVRGWIAPTILQRPASGFIAVIALFLLLLLFGPIDAQRLVPFTILFIAALFGVELLRRQLAREFPQDVEKST